MNDIPKELAELLGNPMSAADAWAQTSGYVAEMVREGSDDAAKILALMHELRPGTRVFTGTVDELTNSKETDR